MDIISKLIDEFVPSTETLMDDVVEGYKASVRQPLLLHEPWQRKGSCKRRFQATSLSDGVPGLVHSTSRVMAFCVAGF
jgi:hypothetical protein